MSKWSQADESMVRDVTFRSLKGATCVLQEYFDHPGKRVLLASFTEQFGLNSLDFAPPDWMEKLAVEDPADECGHVCCEERPEPNDPPEGHDCACWQHSKEWRHRNDRY
jgi:hypothetical protein